MDYNVDIDIPDDEIVSYVKDNMYVEDVFDEDHIKKYISGNFDPSDVFDEATLVIWAVNHGFVKTG